MKPRVKYGLVVGVIALIMNVFVSFMFGFCGPVLTLIAGAIAAFLTTREETAANQSDGALYGGIAGLIAGAFTLIGQVIASIGALLLVTTMDIPPIIGTLPDPSDAAQQTIFWVSGVTTGVCFGLVGLVLGALAGAAVGYLSSKESTAVSPPADMPSA